MPFGIRKVVRYAEDVHIEGAPGEPVRMIGVAAVLPNPWAGRGFVENLRPEILAIAPAVADVLVPAALELACGGDRVEAYGKAALVGSNGEVEHASAIIHTLRFGNVLRSAVGGTTFLSFTNSRSGPGANIAIPMMHKHDEGLRSHYLTLNFNVPDAPGPDELLVAIGVSTGGRLHPRIGNRYIDMEELAAEAAARDAQGG
ncbi:MAG: amino acid synthesis family protein [Actinomycetota bacterium]